MNLPKEKPSTKVETALQKLISELERIRQESHPRYVYGQKGPHFWIEKNKRA